MAAASQRQPLAGSAARSVPAQRPLLVVRLAAVLPQHPALVLAALLDLMALAAPVALLVLLPDQQVLGVAVADQVRARPMPVAPVVLPVWVVLVEPTMLARVGVPLAATLPQPVVLVRAGVEEAVAAIRRVLALVVDWVLPKTEPAIRHHGGHRPTVLVVAVVAEALARLEQPVPGLLEVITVAAVRALLLLVVPHPTEQRVPQALSLLVGRRRW